MFKFNDYPSIKEMHKRYLKQDYASTKALINVVDKNALGAEAKFEKTMNKQDAFNLLYEKVIFDELIKEKPDIFDKSTGKYEKWDSLIGSEFSKIPNSYKIIFILLVEENGGIYRLPPSYYI